MDPVNSNRNIPSPSVSQKQPISQLDAKHSNALESEGSSLATSLPQLIQKTDHTLERTEPIKGKISGELPYESAIQALLGNNQEFNQLERAQDLRSIRKYINDNPRTKASCKEIALKHFQSMDFSGLSAEAVKNVYKLLKNSIYAFAKKEGRLPETVQEVARVWQNLGARGVNGQIQAFEEEMEARLILPNIDADKAMEPVAKTIAERAASDPAFFIKLTNFQSELEEIQKKPRKERPFLLQQLLKSSPEFDIQLNLDLRSVVIKKAEDLMETLPPEKRKELTLEVQKQLEDCMKAVLLRMVPRVSVEKLEKSEQSSYPAFKDVKELFDIVGTRTPKDQENKHLVDTVLDAGLKPMGFIGRLRRNSITISVEGGRKQYYDKEAVEKAVAAKAACRAIVEGVHSDPKKREEALKAMLKDRVIHSIARERANESVQKKMRELPESYVKDPKTDLKDVREYFYNEKVTELFQWLSENSSLESLFEYHEGMERELARYTPEALKQDSKRYQEFMDFLSGY